ncbi:phosphatase and actin regulator 2-like isoform X2 [Mizuhopecten yessoensis]|uniref:phosphatase and actin regulator 2-like isoform X2 n=1 Tax=Mizuhopecten yessoensis TaxID=6573 RepID=UPI000B45CFA9|nr:phosphatase and actin regulator 2-like isoform X2 [Mizuhopecten yessoensis]
MRDTVSSVYLCFLVICVGAVWVPGSSGHPQPSLLTDQQSDNDYTQSVLLQKLTATERVSHPERSSDSDLGVYTDKEVDSPSVFHRSKHTLFHASLQSREPPQIKTSQTSSKFYNSLKLSGAEGDLAKSEALSQEVGDRERHKDKSMSKMVVTIVSTVTALVSMSLLVAIFQCCCRRKKRRSSDAKASEDTVKTLVSNEDGRQSGEEVKPLNEEEDKQKEERQDREPSEEKDVSVKNRIKAFEEKPTSPSDVRGQVTKKRPESDAFKVFENKGILIGMGRTPKPKVTIEESDGEELDQERNDESPSSTKTSPAVSPKPAKSPAVSPKPSKDRLYPDNPDVVIASEDEDDEFAVIKRESDVLKSFTKASAPKTRNRTSQAVGGRRARATNSPAPKPVSTIEEKTEEKGVTSPLLNSKESDDSKTREEKQKLLESVIDKSVVKSGTKEFVTSNTTKNNPSSDSCPVSQSNIDTSGNIFLQIDPTAKRRSTGSTPVHSPEKDVPTTERPKSTHEVIKGSPRPSPKPSPKPIRDDQLMKALSERLKKQSPDKEKADDL